MAWHPLGWEAVAYSEIERFPSEVLAHHYPQTPNLGDMTKFKEWNLESNVDLLVGGTPCQSFSVAGLRKGLDDPRGNLMLTYLAIADKYRPRWLVWENVPGVLSSNAGKDFGVFLGGLGELGYGFAYRVLDAQYFGVAQRRRRVFVVGCLGDWRPAAAVLFERHSLSGHPAPSREKRKDVAGSLTSRASGGGGGPGAGTDEACAGYLQPVALAENTIGRQPQNGGNGDGFTDGGPMYTLNATGVHGVAQPMAFAQNTRDEVRYINGDGAIAGVLAAESGMKQTNYVHQAMAVRRLTPVECERLQGFPDNYTKIADKTPDGPRYKALGNSMAVPVMAWIGQRIEQVEAICKQNKSPSN